MAINKTEAETWCVDFRDQYKRRHERTFDTYREAAAYEKEVAALVQKREYVHPTTRTVQSVAEEWLQRKIDAGTYRRATIVDYRNHVKNYITPEIGALKVADVGIETVEKASTDWGKRVSPKMVNKVLTTLTGVFALAKRYKLAKDNPAQEAERLKLAAEAEEDMEVAPDHVYTKDEVRKLVEATEPGSVDRLMVMTPALTGVRVGEALGLIWPNVDFKDSKLAIRLNLADTDKGMSLTLQPPKTRSSIRTIPLPPELAREMKIWKLRCPKSDQGFVFCREDGQPYNRKSVSAALDRAISGADLEKRLTPHGLRHSFASLLLADSVPVPEVSAYLGHRDCSITLKVYSHFVREETRAVENLAASIMGVR